MDLSLTLANTNGFPWEAQVALARSADRLGYTRLWVAEAYSWDGVSQLGAFASITERIGLASGAVNVFSRSPALLGQTAATLDRISGGRFALGLGTSGPQVIQGWHGVPFQSGAQRLRETVEIVRLVVARERVRYDGQVFQLDGGLKLVDYPVRPAVEIYLASLTPAGLRLTAEVADGWLAAFISPSHYRTVFQPHLASDVTNRGDRAPLKKCVLQTVVLTSDRVAARALIRPQLALYIGGMGKRGHNFYNELFQRYGFAEEVACVQKLFLDRRRDEAAAAITDSMVDCVSIIGDADECRHRLVELEALGIDEVAVQIALPETSPATMLAAVEALAA